MTKKIYLMLLSIFLSVTYLSAQVVQTVNVPTAGGLATAIGSNLKTVTDLTLTGTINAADFNTIKQMTALKNLDMSKVAVVDNAIPASAFANSKMENLVLPSTLENIGPSAFANTSTKVDLSKSKLSLKTISTTVFSNYTGSSRLDFSDYPNLIFGTGYYVGTFADYSGLVILPSHYTSVPEMCFTNFKGIVELSEKIKTIGSRAFYGARMEHLDLPEGLKSIGDNAFTNVVIKDGLTTPSTLENIGSGSFANSSMVVDFSKTKSSLSTLGQNVFSNYTGSQRLDFSDFTSLKNFAGGFGMGPFTGYKGYVKLPANMENLPAFTFAQFGGTTDLPQGLKTIGRNAFELSTMPSIELPSGVTTLGDDCFKNSMIPSLVLPSSVTTIGSGSFANSSMVVDFSKTKSSLSTLGQNVFSNYTGSQRLDFSDFTSLKNFAGGFGMGPFTGYKGYVKLPANMENLPAFTFAQFGGTTDLPQGLKTIGRNAFELSTMPSIELPSGVTTLGDDCFKNSMIPSLVLPSSVTTIGSGSFANSSMVVDFSKTKSSLSTLGQNVFSNYTGSQRLDFSDFTSLKNFAGGFGMGPFTGYKGYVKLPANMENLPAFTFAQFGGTTDLPQGLKTIGRNAFELSTMPSIELPSGVTTLGDDCFKNSMIPSLVLPSSVTTIGSGSFANSSMVVDFSKTKSSLSTLGQNVFSNYTGSQRLDFSDFTSLKNFAGGFGMGPFTGYKGYVKLPANMENLPAFTFAQFGGTTDLPQGLKTIGRNAFELSTMPSIELPSGVTTLGDDCFKNSMIPSLVLPSSVTTIGSGSFANSSMVVDFSKTKSSLSTLGQNVFSNYTGSQRLDFSDFTSLKNFAGGFGMGPFTGYKGYVKLPANMENLPAFTFAQFGGTTDLPQGLKTIGRNAFELSTMPSIELPSGVTTLGDDCFKNSMIPSLVLPSSVTTIGSGSFANSSMVVDFSKTKSSLSTLGQNVFSNYTGSQRLDFSDFTSLKNFAGGFGMGPFTGYKGYVKLPANMENLPAFTFAQFGGTTDLPQGLKTIGNNAFELSTIKKIELPPSVTFMGNNAFYNATQLSKIISNSPIPPALGTNVFYGVNKETTTLEVPSGSINLYGTASQWKDFLSVNATVPSKVNLLYRIGVGHDSNSNFNIYDQGAIEVPYDAVRIGEYYWMTNNFSHVEPLRKWWNTIRSGDEEAFPLTQEVLNTYLERMETVDSQFQVDIQEFNKEFGIYYSSYSIAYMQEWGRVFENNDVKENRNWNLPKLSDYRQLMAMTSFRNSNATKELNVFDVVATLGATDQSMLEYKIIDDCGGDWSYWTAFAKEGNNPYNFNLMFSGNRLNGPDSQRFMAGCYDKHIDIEKGSLIQLFHASQMAAQDGYLSLAEIIQTRQSGHHDGYYCINNEPVKQVATTNHWLPARWCRVLTNEELGYKLYIKIDNIPQESKEWKSFSEQGYEIDLLNKMRNNNIPTDQTSIIKLGLNDPIPTGYIELPHGYIRGFYVQYILDKPNTTVTVSDVMKYAYNVQDFVLDYKQEYVRVPGSSIPSPTPAGACQTTTRSLVSDEVVVPFKTDESVTLYPNPVQDALNISGDNVEKVTIYDMSGRQVSTAKNVNTLSVSDLSKGTYLVRILTASGESTHKVIKK